MSKNLVIVESPAKAKTIEKYLGSGFTVLSSIGHIRDLPKKGGVDIENNFTPSYEVTSDKKKTVSALKKAAKVAETVWLASDRDREGEAIAWHLQEILGVAEDKVKRITFNEITKTAVEGALQAPRTVDGDLVGAYQARRILDRLVGYEVSSVLWKKVSGAKSAGRVQSAPVRIVVEREREINEFNAKVSFKIGGTLLTTDGEELPVKLKPDLKSADEAEVLLNTVNADAQLTVADLQQKPGVRRPGAPFTTSSLQITASNKIGYSPKRTMGIAQALYQGGHITYMRTDSINLAKEAHGAIKALVHDKFGESYYKSRMFKTKDANAQEAHEAIRPTNMSVEVAGKDDAERKLYNLIRSRAIASQMADAKTLKTEITVDIAGRDEKFIAKGEQVEFEGFLAITGRGDDDILPDIKSGDRLTKNELTATETPSKPPARYTEASLVKKLEELGIGRPSTYATIISTIQSRNYVEKGSPIEKEVTFEQITLNASGVSRETITKTMSADRNRLYPTSIAFVLTDFLMKNFEQIVDYDFTKKVEDQFDHIAQGELAWQDMLSAFYGPFHKTVVAAEGIDRAEANQSRELGKDPKSGKPVSARYGRFGPMVQIGTKDDEEKPSFASIPNTMTLETITLEESLELFKLPRVLGETPEGEEVSANNGRYGPYIKFASMFVSIKPLDPMTITLEEALELVAEKKKTESEKTIMVFEEAKIQILNGRYGPYVTDGKTNASVPKKIDAKTLDLAGAQQILADKKAKGPTKKRGAKKTTKKK